MDTDSQVTKRLVEHFQGREKAAEAFDISGESIRLWRKKGIPLDRALEVERRTKGAITAEEILAEARQRATPSDPRAAA